MVRPGKDGKKKRGIRTSHVKAPRTSSGKGTEREKRLQAEVENLREDGRMSIKENRALRKKVAALEEDLLLLDNRIVELEKERDLQAADYARLAQDKDGHIAQLEKQLTPRTVGDSPGGPYHHGSYEDGWSR